MQYSKINVTILLEIAIEPGTFHMGFKLPLCPPASHQTYLLLSTALAFPSPEGGKTVCLQSVTHISSVNFHVTLTCLSPYTRVPFLKLPKPLLPIFPDPQSQPKLSSNTKRHGKSMKNLCRNYWMKSDNLTTGGGGWPSSLSRLWMTSHSLAHQVNVEQGRYTSKMSCPHRSAVVVILCLFSLFPGSIRSSPGYGMFML